jgi:hypothetical protein
MNNEPIITQAPDEPATRMEPVYNFFADEIIRDHCYEMAKIRSDVVEKFLRERGIDESNAASKVRLEVAIGCLTSTERILIDGKLVGTLQLIEGRFVALPVG